MTKMLLLLLLGLVIGNANSSTEEGIAKIKEKGRHCIQDIIGKPGWSCNDGTCLPLSNVCDNFDTQCPDGDDSDEVDGCWLFPEETCKSVGAQKMVKCPHSEQCVPDQGQDLCQNQNKPTNDTSCPFRCKSGHCIAKTFVCNREFECEDKTDETEGCQLHGQAQDQCKSWSGNQFVTCPNDTSICTLPQFVDNCRQCDDANHWRCNDGWCIEKSRINDGVADCLDRSDEDSESIKWWTLLIMVICISGFGVFASFIVRGLVFRTNLLRCKFCDPAKEEWIDLAKRKPLKSQSSIKKPRRENGHGDDQVDFTHQYTDPEAKIKLENEAYGLPMVLINLLEKSENWSENQKTLQGRYENEGQYQYAHVHQNPMEYKNTYQYLVFRYQSPDRLSRVVNKLHQWELDFHDHEHTEVLKCWRLHLGSCDVLKDVIAAQNYDSNSTLNSITNKIYLPIKNKWRDLRRIPKDKFGQDIQNQENCCKKFLKGCAWLYNTLFFAFRPFLGASALYFDIFKNISFVYLFWTAFEVLTDGKEDEEIAKAELEYAMIVFMLTAIILVQVSFMILSSLSSRFMICEHTKKNYPRRVLLIRILCFILGPIAPIIIFANYIYNREQEHFFKRELQTHGNLDRDIGNNVEIEAEEMMKEAKIDPDVDAIKVLLYRKILKFRYKAALNKRYYSYYRVIQATMESINVLDVLLMFLIVSSKPGRLEKNGRTFFDIVSEKIAEFLGFNSSQQLETFGISSILAFYCALLISLLMIITAIARYVFQSKNSNMSLKGQTCYGLFIVMHLINRITFPISILATSQNANPAVSFIPASILCAIFSIIQFLAIFLFKYLTIPEFKKEPLEHQVVHVLANTIVVIPYSTWDHDEPDPNLTTNLEQIKLNKKRKSSLPALLNHKNHRRNKSLDNHSFQQNFKRGHKRNRSDGDALKFQPMTTMTQTVQESPLPNIVDLLVPNLSQMESKKTIRDKILKIWWNNPAEKITPEDAKKKLVDFDARHIEEVFQSLEDKGFINKKMFNPRRTKTEYFWLLILFIAFNLAAFGIEFANAGAKLSVTNGNYYSWDVRSATFVMGLIFLGLYYKKYHVMRKLIKFRYCGWGLNYCPIFFGAKSDQPMQAIPNEVKLERILSEEELFKDKPDKPTQKTLQTQTSNTFMTETETAVQVDFVQE